MEWTQVNGDTVTHIAARKATIPASKAVTVWVGNQPNQIEIGAFHFVSTAGVAVAVTTDTTALKATVCPQRASWVVIRTPSSVTLVHNTLDHLSDLAVSDACYAPDQRSALGEQCTNIKPLLGIAN